MERRHQVFISSTFSDLIEERAEIIQALLELDCIPAGMEMFPATSDGAWDLIKGVIDDSDYYCLVIGGRYGSQGVDGVGFTEKEYDYAVFKGKPLIAFLHKNPSDISVGNSEQSAEGREKLFEFRKKVEASHHCKYWSSATELGGQVSRSLISLRKTYPSEGWVPGSYASDEASRIEVANLRARVAELEAELARREKDTVLELSETLACGGDVFRTEVHFRRKGSEGEWIDISVTWDEILKYVGPSLLAECSEDAFLDKLNLCYFHAIQLVVDDEESVLFESITLPHIVVDQIKVQLRALGQMVPGVKRRAVSDKKNYWKLSLAGENRLMSVQAISKRMSLAPPGLSVGNDEFVAAKSLQD